MRLTKETKGETITYFFQSQTITRVIRPLRGKEQVDSRPVINHAPVIAQLRANGFREI